MNIEKAKILDDILRRFKGNVTISWADLHSELGPTRQYFVTENNIKYLLGDGMLTEDKSNQRLCLSDKGFATYTDIETLGYVTKFKKERRDNLIRYIGFGITVATFGLLLFRNLAGPEKETPLKLAAGDSIKNQKTQITPQSTFERYLNSLPKIDLPTNLVLSTDGNRYEYGEFEKFKTIWSDKPFGQLFQVNDKTVIVDLQIGSSYAAILVVYDRVGNKLDSLYAYKTDSGPDFEISEQVYIDSDKRIVVTLTTEKWVLTPDRTTRIGSSKTVTIDTTTYTVDDKGRFKELKK